MGDPAGTINPCFTTVSTAASADRAATPSALFHSQNLPFIQPPKAAEQTSGGIEMMALGGPSSAAYQATA